MVVTLKRILGNGSLLLAGICVGLVLLELLARLYLPAPVPERLPLCKVQADSLLGWKMVANHFHYTYSHPVQINSLGLRDREVGPKKDNEYRILVLGDSHVYGQGVSNEQTFTNRLEQRLNSGVHEVFFRVINAGVRAYSINQEIAFLETTGLALKPNFVILSFYLNDFESVNVTQSYLSHKFDATGRYIFDLNGPESEILLQRWRHMQALRQFRALMFIYDRVKAWHARDDYRSRMLNGTTDPDIGDKISRVSYFIIKFKELLDGNKLQGLIAVVPYSLQITRDFPNEIYQSTISTIAKQTGLDYVDLLPAFKRDYAATRRVPTIPYDGHYDSGGHGIICDALYDHLVERWTNGVRGNISDFNSHTRPSR